MEMLGNVYVLSMLAGIVYVLFCVVDSKMNNKEKSTMDNLKTFIVGSLVTLVTLTVKNQVSTQVGGATNKIAENIFTGNPNF